LVIHLNSILCILNIIVLQWELQNFKTNTRFWPTKHYNAITANYKHKNPCQRRESNPVPLTTQSGAYLLAHQYNWTLKNVSIIVKLFTSFNVKFVCVLITELKLRSNNLLLIIPFSTFLFISFYMTKYVLACINHIRL